MESPRPSAATDASTVPCGLQARFRQGSCQKKLGRQSQLIGQLLQVGEVLLGIAPEPGALH
ncbi:hypothetical protein, partial [Azohydromonas australica]|uniref:hypothetical protein n=1 Tax=Azohydromonas australica TaxID=364039 RepID=UPI001B7F7B44